MGMEKNFSVYILASGKHGTLYIGMTANLPRRIAEHRSKSIEGFTKRYDVSRLVYFEMHDNFESAAKREKNMKAWKRDWKTRLIEEQNPDWQDLFPVIAG